ncbi:unnamed protein product [Durusdinium trenchii]|uniref:Uncharacterized protein n=1 Tax=Durusdinium trenchii TaxID=1381693 RepID=A0ABP0LAR8_9DINO
MGSCPEVSLLGELVELRQRGRIVVVERICQSLLQNPLSADASDRQEVLLQDVKDMIPNLEANLQLGRVTVELSCESLVAGERQHKVETDTNRLRRIGYLTQLPELIVSHLLEGACGKMIQASFFLGWSTLGVNPGCFRVSGVLEPSYRWPQPHLADESLKQRGLDCEEAELIQVGAEPADAIGFVAAFGSMVWTKSTFWRLGQEIRLDVILLRPRISAGRSVYVRRGTMVFAGDMVREDRNCSSCHAAVLPVMQSSHFLKVQKQENIQLGATLPRAYSWSAELAPMRCRSTGWHPPSAPLPPRRPARSPSSSAASCTGHNWVTRSCRFRRMCYDVEAESFEFYGGPSNDLSEDYMVGLSMFSDSRMTWKPNLVEARWREPEGSVPSLEEEQDGASMLTGSLQERSRSPAATQVTGSPSLAVVVFSGVEEVRTTLALYALIMSNEDLKDTEKGGCMHGFLQQMQFFPDEEVHGRRWIFFLDDCSLELQGDSIEFCMQFVPKPINCIQEIPHLCAKFTQQLWPLLTDWAPLEQRAIQPRLGATRRCRPRSTKRMERQGPVLFVSYWEMLVQWAVAFVEEFEEC